MNSNKTVQHTINDISEAGVTFARENFHVELDYSENSLKDLEKILDLLFDSIPKKKGKKSKSKAAQPTDKQIQSVALMLGAYLGEVIRRKWGGNWKFRTGKKRELSDGYVLISKTHETFPINKVFKRLINGIDDNILLFYDALCHSILK